MLPPDTNRPESYATFGQIANVTLNATARVLEAYIDVSSLGTSAAARSFIRQLITSEAGWVRFGREAGKAADEVINTAEGAGNAAENSVYLSKAADGAVQYVGITNDVARRAAEHLSQKGIQIRSLMNGLSRSDARSVEQALIEIHGLEKNGGTLINKINSIAKSNPNYATSLERGYELLQSIGYK